MFLKEKVSEKLLSREELSIGREQHQWAGVWCAWARGEGRLKDLPHLVKSEEGCSAGGGSHTRGLALSMVLVTRLFPRPQLGIQRSREGKQMGNSLAQSLWGLGEEDQT